VMVGDTGSHGTMSSSEEIKIMEDVGGDRFCSLTSHGSASRPFVRAQ